jgi:predicted lipoprotein with Yx(FWY)xxD motif
LRQSKLEYPARWWGLLLHYRASGWFREEENMRKLLMLTIAATLMAATVALAQMAPTKIGDSAKGKVLTNEQGMTLYVFDKDSPGKSACNGPCATNWPPLMASTGAMAMGDYTIITRNDGTKQWAYKGRPLYTWKNDKKPGDITGDGFLNGAWHIAQP